MKLYNNGKVMGEADVDKVVTFTVPLSDVNKLEVRAGKLRDTAVLRKVSSPNPSYKLKKDKNRQKSNWV